MLPERVRLPTLVNGAMVDPAPAKPETYNISDKVYEEVMTALMIHKKERGGGLKARVKDFMSLYRFNVIKRTRVDYTFENATPELARNATISWWRGRKQTVIKDPRLSNSANIRLPENLSVILLMAHTKDPAFISLLRHYKDGATAEETGKQRKCGPRNGKKRKASVALSADSDSGEDDSANAGGTAQQDGRENGDGHGAGGADREEHEGDGDARAQGQVLAGGGHGAAADRGGGFGGSAGRRGSGSAGYGSGGSAGHRGGRALAGNDGCGAAGQGGGVGGSDGRGGGGRGGDALAGAAQGAAGAGRGRGSAVAGRGIGARGRGGGVRGRGGAGIVEVAGARAAAEAAAAAAAARALANAEGLVAPMVAPSVYMDGSLVGSGSICPNLDEYHGAILPSDVVSVFLGQLAPTALSLVYPFSFDSQYCLEPTGAGPSHTTLEQCANMRSVWSIKSIGYVRLTRQWCALLCPAL